MMVDDNERLSSSISSTQRHCRRCYCFFFYYSISNQRKEKRLRPNFNKGILVLLTSFLLQIVHARVSTSLHHHRDLQGANTPSMGPSGSPSGQPSISASPSRSFQPSPAPSISQEPSINPSRRMTEVPSLRPTTALPTSGTTVNGSFPTTGRLSQSSTLIIYVTGSKFMNCFFPILHDISLLWFLCKITAGVSRYVDIRSN